MLSYIKSGFKKAAPSQSPTPNIEKFSAEEKKIMEYIGWAVGKPEEQWLYPTRGMISLLDCAIICGCTLLCAFSLLLTIFLLREKRIIAKLENAGPKKPKLTTNEKSFILFHLLLAIACFGFFFIEKTPEYILWDKKLLARDVIYCIALAYGFALVYVHEILRKILTLVERGMDIYVRFSFLFLTEKKKNENGEVYKENRRFFEFLCCFLFLTFWVGVCLISRFL